MKTLKELFVDGLEEISDTEMQKAGGKDEQRQGNHLMNNNIGLWIDHRKAVIILDSDGREEIKGIESHVDKQPGRIDGERSNEAFESLQVPADDTTDRRFAHHLQTYYDEVIACIREADSLLILGPGEAKGEFLKRLEKSKPSGRLVTVETADKMTERQVAAKVREFFKRENPVITL